tara:strand:- start:5370 stop:5900 length:531 start_codon:yes stop_codon:yes gene_type:complete
MPVKLIANALLFQASWFACVLGGTSAWLLIPLAALVIHFTWISSWAAEGKLVVSVMLAGTALDSFLLQMGVFSFPGEPLLAPLWLVLLWAILGTTLNHCLAWSAKPLWLACLLGAIAGPLSYFAGAALADVGLPLGMQTSAIVLAVCWAIIYPLLHGFAHLYREQFRLRQQRPTKS